MQYDTITSKPVTCLKKYIYDEFNVLNKKLQHLKY